MKNTRRTTRLYAPVTKLRVRTIQNEDNDSRHNNMQNTASHDNTSWHINTENDNFYFEHNNVISHNDTLGYTEDFNPTFEEDLLDLTIENDEEVKNSLNNSFIPSETYINEVSVYVLKL